MVDGVAGRAPEAEHLPGRVLQRPERGDVLIAVSVNLIGAHHHMPPTPGERLEYPAERHPALDGSGRAQRRGVRQQLCLTVGQQDVGEKVKRASRAPTEAMLVIGLTMISPASLNNSAQATAQTSARGARGVSHEDASSANVRTAAWYSASPPDR